MVTTINERIWRNSCVNNAVVLLSITLEGYNAHGINDRVLSDRILELAKEISNSCRSWVQGDEE